MSWQSIETAPRDGTFVLLCCLLVEDSPAMFVGRYDDFGYHGWMVAGQMLPDDCMAHWQPLPEPPSLNTQGRD